VLDHKSGNFKLDYQSFVRFTNESWFKDNIKEVEIPFSSINSSIDSFSIYTRKISFISDDLLTLFNKSFPIQFKHIFTMMGHNLLGFRKLTSENLFYQAFYEIFHEYIKKGSDIESVLSSLIKDWSEFIKSKNMPFELRIPLRDVTFSGELQGDDRFKLINISDDFLTDKNSGSTYLFSGLAYNTVIKVVTFETIEELVTEAHKDRYRNQLQQYSKIYIDLKKFLTSIYLKGYDISDEVPHIEHPWWSPFKYEIILHKSEDSYYRSRGWPKNMESRDFKNIIVLFERLKENDFFHKKCFPMTRSLMELALSRKSDIDRVFDAHIFLEFLFGPGDQGELSFRVSMNGALFISDNFEEFKKNFYFFRNLYNIRSAAIHGGDWLDNSKKKLKGLVEKGWEFSNIIEMFGMLENIIRLITEKLIELDVNIVHFRNQVNGDPLFFFKLAKFILRGNFA